MAVHFTQGDVDLLGEPSAQESVMALQSAAALSKATRSLGVTVESILSERPLWINTAGLGVSWLHFRLDSRPKYYHHHPYKTY